MTALPYNRALHPDDYAHLDLVPYVAEVESFEQRLRLHQVPYRKDHAHRVWEYANVLRQLDELNISPGSSVLDVGSGGSYLPVLLATRGYRVTASDSMAYGDCTAWMVQQSGVFDVLLPVLVCPVEQIDAPDGAFDATVCVSVIEHVAPDRVATAWQELARVTRPGGAVMVTSDYFSGMTAWEQSPFRSIQHSPITADAPLAWMANLGLPLTLVGGVDWTYRGDTVYNYSFVNLCFIRQ